MAIHRRRTARAARIVAACALLVLARSALAQGVLSEALPAASPVTSPKAAARPPAPPALPAEALPGGRPGPQGVLQTMRWTENWSAVPAADAPLLEKIRHIPIGPGVYLSLGGEARLYYTGSRHAALGLRAGDDNDPLQLRLRLLADLHLGPYVRAFVEFGDNREFGERTATAANLGKVDIRQAFVDVTVPLGDAGRITLRPGRFEMPLGNSKLVGVREALNQRFSYQGIRGTYILPGTVSVDLFALRPVALKPGTFDDGPNHAVTFTGAYVSAPNRVAGFGTDVYWYAVRRDRGVLAQGAGRDDRSNWGARVWQRTTRWDLDVEGTYQSGTFTNKAIRSFAVLVEGGYSFAGTAMAPRLGLRANVFSGDKDLNDGKAATFVAASPRLTLISEGAFLNLSNLMDLYPSLTLKPRSDVTIMVGPDFLWRNRRADGVYIGATGASFAPYASSRAIGADLNLEATWQVTRRLQVRLFETYFAASDSFAAHGGRNANYLGVQSGYRF